MYPFFHELLSDKKGGEIFTLFSPWHFAYMLLTLTVIGASLWKGKERSPRERENTLRFWIGAAFGLYILDFFLMPLAYGEIDIEKLPFHACTAMCVMCFLSSRMPCLARWRESFALLGLISNLVYLIYPAGVMWHGVHPLSYRVIQTLLFHCLMTVYGVLFAVYEIGAPSAQNMRRDFLVTAAMTLWAMLGNFVYNGTAGSYSHFFNWFFVVRDPFSFFPERVAPYVMPVLNVALFFCVELLLRCAMALRGGKKNLKDT